MPSRFFSRNNQDDDLLQMQKSALSDATDKSETETAEKEPEGAPAVKSVEEKSVLQKGLTVTGSITSKTSIFIYGTVNGDVTCESDITVDGVIEGNVKAGSVQVLNGKIKGDVEASGSLSIMNGAVIKGNITAGSLSCDGKVDGNSTVSGMAAIKENADIVGDIACEHVSISEGASFKGSIQTSISRQKQEQHTATIKEKVVKNTTGAAPAAEVLK